MGSSLRAAVVQAAPAVFNTAATLDKLHALCAEAARTGAQIAVFPEAFVAGYPKGLDFGTRVGMQLAEGRDQFRRFFDSAIEVPGPQSDAIGAAARNAGLHLAVGVVERSGSSLYSALLTYGPDGRLLGRRRKLVLTGMERLIWGPGDAQGLAPPETPLGRLGGLIGWECYLPALRMALYQASPQLCCVATVDDRDTWPGSMQHIALEGRCFVLSACQYLTLAACPEDYPALQGNDPETLLIRGGSCIVSPLGQLLAGPNYEGEAILTADLDMGEIVRGKYDFDVAGHSARPDVFRLAVADPTRRPGAKRDRDDDPSSSGE